VTGDPVRQALLLAIVWGAAAVSPNEAFGQLLTQHIKGGVGRTSDRVHNMRIKEE
jgi:hypothetical protein